MPRRNQRDANLGKGRVQRPRQPTKPTVSEDGALRAFSQPVTWFVTVPFAVIVGLAGIYGPALIGLGWTLVAIVWLSLLAIAFRIRASTRYRRRIRVSLIVTMAIILVASPVIWYVRRPVPPPPPTAAEIVVDQMLEDVRSAEGWISPPLIFPESRDFIVENFAAFDPKEHHGWDELPDPQVDNLLSVVKNANVHAGGATVTAGLDAAEQQVGMQILSQLQPLDPQTARKLEKEPTLASLVPREFDRGQLLDGAVAPKADSHAFMFCLITPRHFAHGDIDTSWVVKGTVVASGRLLRDNGSLAQVAYMWCSSAERF